MNPESIANKARKSIGKFCFEECKSYCCRKGYLVMTKKEASLISPDDRKKLEDADVFNEIDIGKYSLYLGNRECPCPHLKDFKCVKHKSRNRPKACQEFPVFIEGHTIRLSARCPAVKMGMVYPYISRLLKMGYKLSKNAPLSDIEFGDMKFV